MLNVTEMHTEPNNFNSREVNENVGLMSTDKKENKKDKSPIQKTSNPEKEFM